MSYVVRLLTGSPGSTAYTFDAVFTEPTHSLEHDDQEPPIVVAITKTYALTGIMYGASESAVITAWDALKTVVEASGASQVSGVEIVRSGTVADSITTAGGYEGLRVVKLTSPKSDMQWRGEMRFSIEITGRKRFASGVSGLGPTVSRLTQQESWTYDESGLLTRSLTGEVETTSGSAVAIARTIFLSLPSSSYAYVTNGPEGVDVERLDVAVRSARFTSTIRESGSALPGLVGPSFTFATETSVANGDTVTTVRVQAVGTGAEAAVRARAPGGVTASTITVEPHGRSAVGTFVVKKTSTTGQVKTRRFAVSGGGRSRTFTRRSRGRAPVAHVGPFAEVEITETLHLEKTGSGGDFSLPAPLDGVDEDTGALRVSGPNKEAPGKDRAGDLWSLDVQRVYRVADASQAYLKILAAVGVISTAPTETGPQNEIQRQGTGGA